MATDPIVYGQDRSLLALPLDWRRTGTDQQVRTVTGFRRRLRRVLQPTPAPVSDAAQDLIWEQIGDALAEREISWWNVPPPWEDRLLDRALDAYRDEDTTPHEAARVAVREYAAEIQAEIAAEDRERGMGGAEE